VGLKRLRIAASQFQWQQNLAITLLVLWGVFILYATLLPFDFSASGALIESRLVRMRERPLKGLGGSLADVISNVLFFMPWGFLLAIWRANRGTRLGRTLLFALLSGAMLSASVEFAQLFAPKRSPSVVDLITNTFGSVVGALIGWVVERWVWPSQSVRLRQALMSRPIKVLSTAVMAGLICAALLPAYDKFGGRGPSASLRNARLVPFGKSSGIPRRAKVGLWGAELICWMMCGGLWALAAREGGRGGARSIGPSIAMSAGLAIAFESVQLIVPGRDVDMSSVVLATVGSAIGATIVAYRSSFDVRRWTAPALGLWGLAVVLAAWNPLRFQWPAPPFMRPERIVPFWSYFGSRTVEDLMDVISQAGAFVPLGALLAARSWRRSFLSVILIALAIGGALELGQAFVADRTVDISDALSAAAGAGLGFALWRWGEYARNSSFGATRYRVGARDDRRV
jgi:VanZ family protein